MNASGRPNTCKSSGKLPKGNESGARVSNAYATCPGQGDSPLKDGLIPHNILVTHVIDIKAKVVRDGHAWH
jgi:hypothetical protein